jgi:cation diffusion facilitator CzcD-associated flavoprotein CzcO
LEEADFDIMENIRARVDAIVKDRATAEALKPWYGRLCKRPCFQDGYLETFNRSNVTLVDTNGRGVDRITSDSVIAVGRSYQVDCLIFATGFEIGTGYTRRSGYEVVGHDGLTLTEKWSEGYQTFHGLFSRSFPNCFFLGISQNANTYNYLDAVGTQVKHAVHILRCAVSRGIAKIECSESAEAEWVAEIKRLARGGKKYHGNCTPGYYNNEGNVDDPRGLLAGAYGEGPLRFYERMANWRDAGDMAGLEMRGR